MGVSFRIFHYVHIALSRERSLRTTPIIPIKFLTVPVQVSRLVYPLLETPLAVIDQLHTYFGVGRRSTIPKSIIFMIGDSRCSSSGFSGMKAPNTTDIVSIVAW